MISPIGPISAIDLTVAVESGRIGVGCPLALVLPIGSFWTTTTPCCAASLAIAAFSSE